MMVQTQVERHSLFVTGDYNITDHIKFSTDLLYNKRSTTAQVAGYPFQPANQIPARRRRTSVCRATATTTRRVST
jgi:hypothetical protein